MDTVYYELTGRVIAARTVQTINRRAFYEYQTTNSEIFQSLEKATDKQLLLTKDNQESE